MQYRAYPAASCPSLEKLENCHADLNKEPHVRVFIILIATKRNPTEAHFI